MTELHNFLILVYLIMIRSESSGEVEAVQTSKNTLHSKKAVIIAAGCWSGSLMHDLIKNSEIKLDLPIKPRKVRYLGVSLNYLLKFKYFFSSRTSAFHSCSLFIYYFFFVVLNSIESEPKYLA